jgi:hypothetical protein
MTSDRYASRRALHAAVNGRELEMPEGAEAAWGIAGFGAHHWRWPLEVVER